METKKNVHGFTLIELLVVIAIIALLVSILLPSLNKAKFLAKKAVNATNLRNIGTANFMYAGDNDGSLPDVANNKNYMTTKFIGWGPLIRDEYASREVFGSPLVSTDMNWDWYWGFDEDGNGNFAKYIPGCTVVAFESWELSAWGDLTTGWGTRGHEHVLGNNEPLGAARQKMAWSSEFDIPYHYGYGSIVYLDGHVYDTSTDSYSEWTAEMAACE